jgi:cysteine desulfurase
MHASVLKAVESLAAQGVATEPLPLSGGAIDLAAFARLLRPETVLVCVDAVCGETGVRYDTLRLRRALDAAGSTQTALHVDASQLPLVEPIERTRLGADLLALDAQKVGGIRGAGALIVPDRAVIAPVMEGGGQESGLRPGTEPVALILAFAEALSVRAQGVASFLARARDMRAYLIREIEARIEGVGHIEGTRQASHILNLQLPGLDTDYLVMLLDRAGYAVSTKSACETDSTDGSKAVLALTNDPERAFATLRISWGPETPARQLYRFPEALATAIAFLRR